jgi:hypothetical protein
MNRVVERRLALWPNKQTRAEAARLLAGGMELGEVLARYPNEVIAVDRGKRRGAARRAIWAHYALLQEAAGEPDIGPGDRAAVERVVREEGADVARCRTGNALKMYEDDFPDLNRWPDLTWYRRQAPSSWPR